MQRQAKRYQRMISFESWCDICMSTCMSTCTCIVCVQAVTLYLIKHRIILIRKGFIDIKSLQVMYDRLFDWSMGL